MRNLCTVDGCTKIVVGNGLCQKHYMRVRRNGTLEPKRGRPKPPCSVCGEPSACVGLCLKHWHAKRRAEIGPKLHHGRECEWCLGEIPATRNVRAMFCSTACKQNAHNFQARNADGYAERNRLYHFKREWAQFNFTIEDYEAMLADQSACCAICKSESSRGRGVFHVDHDHASGRVRGLLCHDCNIGLGVFRDDPALLEAAMKYLIA